MHVTNRPPEHRLTFPVEGDFQLRAFVGSPLPSYSGSAADDRIFFLDCLNPPSLHLQTLAFRSGLPLERVGASQLFVERTSWTAICANANLLAVIFVVIYFVTLVRA